MELFWAVWNHPVVSEYVLRRLPTIVIVLFVILTVAAYLVYAERKISAFIQARLGPMRVGPYGLLQPLADALKLLSKEDIIPARAERSIFVIAPMISVVASLVVLAVIPFGPGRATITDINIGLLFILAVSSVGVLGIILGGWASNSKYPLLGALRSSAQMVSYEVAIALALVGPLLFAKTLSMVGVIEAQMSDRIWYVFYQPVAFLIFLVGGLAETNRAPFDLPEAESEIVAGYHTEYSGFRWALYFVAEYTNIVISAALATTVFLGGWHFPGMTRLAEPGTGLYALLAVIVFAAKVFAIVYCFIWFRWTFPRYRYDQLMSLGWKWLIPAGLANILVTGVVLVLAQQMGLVETVRTDVGERLVSAWPWGKLFLIAASVFVGVPTVWIVLAVINRRSADFNLRVQRQIRLPERGEEEVFAEV
jgi:NADH-quinone oxidoreductase subunit H